MRIKVSLTCGKKIWIFLKIDSSLAAIDWMMWAESLFHHLILEFKISRYI